MLLEAGDRQPRSLAEAFRSPCKAETGQAVAALCDHLAALDSAYATGETRRVMSLANTEVPDAERGSLADLAQFAKSLPEHLKAPEAA
jgi:CRISPR system Cascade subunit CasC